VGVGAGCSRVDHTSLVYFFFMEILFVGDTHGNTAYALCAIRVARALGISRVVQVGDFGVWPGSKGHLFLDAVSGASRDANVTFSFIDGNHEDFDQLDEALAGNDRCPDGGVWLRDHLLWYPRGTVCDLGGRTFAFVGGAASVDKHRRVRFVSWWPQENLTVADLDRLAANVAGRDIDVLVTHDVPDCVDLPFPINNHWPADVLREAAQQRVLLDDAVAVTRPRLLIHGHWHATYSTKASYRDHHFVCHGLCGDSGDEPIDGLGILDVDTLELRPVPGACADL
jgi:hypothetical protein